VLCHIRCTIEAALMVGGHACDGIARACQYMSAAVRASTHPRWWVSQLTTTASTHATRSRVANLSQRPALARAGPGLGGTHACPDLHMSGHVHVRVLAVHAHFHVRIHAAHGHTDAIEPVRTARPVCAILSLPAAAVGCAEAAAICRQLKYPPRQLPRKLRLRRSQSIQIVLFQPRHGTREVQW